jgi:hypothetical protein
MLVWVAAHNIVALPTDEPIVSHAPEKLIVTPETPDYVVALQSMDSVIATSATQIIRIIGTG